MWGRNESPPLKEVFMKRCPKCNTSKDYNEFNRCKSRPDGYDCYCRLCRKKHREENSEYYRKQRKEYYLQNSRYIVEKALKWREDNEEKAKATARKYYQKHKHTKFAYSNKTEDIEKRNARNRKWKKTEKGKACVTNYNHKRRDRIFGNGTPIIPPTTEFIRYLLDNGCNLCNNQAEHIDHWIPLSKGGVHGAENLVGLCVACNLRKGTNIL